MNRRELLTNTAALGLAAAASTSYGSSSAAGPLKAPKSGIVVAYPLSNGVIDIDFTGPSGVFGSVMLPGNGMDMPFHQYCVAQTKDPVMTAAGLAVIPDYTFESAPQPQVIVIAAQSNAPEAMVQWIRKASAKTNITLSVCTGAFVLARTGLLNGKSATTHHSAYDRFAAAFPDIHVVRGVRFVDEGNVATAGGLTCGIDLALHVVDRYFGRSLTGAIATYLEYKSQGWKESASA